MLSHVALLSTIDERHAATCVGVDFFGVSSRAGLITCQSCALDDRLPTVHDAATALCVDQEWLSTQSTMHPIRLIGTSTLVETGEDVAETSFAFPHVQSTTPAVVVPARLPPSTPMGSELTCSRLLTICRASIKGVARLRALSSFRRAAMGDLSRIASDSSRRVCTRGGGKRGENYDLHSCAVPSTTGCPPPGGHRAVLGSPSALAGPFQARHWTRTPLPPAPLVREQGICGSV